MIREVMAKELGVDIDDVKVLDPDDRVVSAVDSEGFSGFTVDNEYHGDGYLRFKVDGMQVMMEEQEEGLVAVLERDYDRIRQSLDGGDESKS